MLALMLRDPVRVVVPPSAAETVITLSAPAAKTRIAVDAPPEVGVWREPVYQDRRARRAPCSGIACRAPCSGIACRAPLPQALGAVHTAVQTRHP